MASLFGLESYLFTLGGLFFVALLSGSYLLFPKKELSSNHSLPRSSAAIRRSAGICILLSYAMLELSAWVQFYYFDSPHYSYAVVYTMLLTIPVFSVTIMHWLITLLQHRQHHRQQPHLPWGVYVPAGLGTAVGFGCAMPLYILKKDILETPWMVIGLIVFLVGWGLAIASFGVWYYHQAKQYHRWLEQNYSSFYGRSLPDMRALTITFVLLMAMTVFANFFIDDDWLVNTILPIVAMVLCLQILFFSEHQFSCELRPHDAQQEDTDQDEDATAVEVIAAEAEDDGLAWIGEQLAFLIQQGKFFCNPDLTLDDLAHLLATNRTYLSRYFSNRNMTFYSYINGLRVQYAMDILRADPSIRQQDLCERCGFRTRQSLVRNFILVTGQSIAEFIASLG